MKRVTISRYTAKGLLDFYEFKTFESEEDIKDYIKSIEKNYYNTSVWNVTLIKADTGWIRIAMNLKNNKRILINVAEI